ncbi:MAG: CBS domain-containing protein [Chitinispirillaceae bacterium]
MRKLPINPDQSPLLVLELIYKLKIKDVMTTEVVTACRDDSMRKVQQLMKDNLISGIPIVEKGRLFGIVSVDDIIVALDKGHIADRLDKHMTRNVIVLEDDMPLSFGINYLEKYKYGRFPVLNKNGFLVGIVTSRDIIASLLFEMNREVGVLESKQASSSEVAIDHIYKEYQIQKLDFENAGKASNEIKKILKSRHVDPKTLRRVAVASYELEINQVVHSEGGKIMCTISPQQVKIVAKDSGPGIKNVEQALQEGYSTANEWIKSLGFGAGLGLPNTRRVSDEFDIRSEVNLGTIVTSKIFLPHTKETTHENA